MSDNDISYNIIENFCIWEDLLGYGRPFYLNDWNLNNEMAQSNIGRIKNLEKILKTVPVPIAEKILFMNDGLIRNVDVHKSGTYVEIYLMWLEYNIQMFREINIADIRQGYCGMRGVLTAGNRTQYTGEILKFSDLVITTRQQDDNIIVYSPSEFQMNTAFSKAYIMEGQGKNQGLIGPHLFIDLFFIDYFVNMINESPVQELSKQTGTDQNGRPTIQTCMLNYSSSFVKCEHGFELKVFVDYGVEKILYRNILFSEEINFDLKDDKKNTMICTKLYKVASLWSIEGNKYFDMDSYPR